MSVRESRARATERAGAITSFELALAPALPHGCEIRMIHEHSSLVRVGKQVRVYDVVLANSGREINRRFVAKEHPDAASARSSHLQLKSLREHGFAPPSIYLVPEPIALAGRLAIEEELPGTPWIEHLSLETSTRAAQWLLRLQQTAIDAAVRNPQEVAAPNDKWQDIARAVNLRLADDGDEPRPSHGDFHPKNVRFGSGYIGVIDIEEIALREPAFDVGDAMTQLLVMSDVDGHPGAGRQAARAFWSHYRQSGSAGASRVCLHIARALTETIAYKLALARAAGEAEPSYELFARLAELFLGADHPRRVLA
jgi:hypothetical protein